MRFGRSILQLIVLNSFTSCIRIDVIIDTVSPHSCLNMNRLTDEVNPNVKAIVCNWLSPLVST